MLLTWRSTVRSLIDELARRSPRLVLPPATSRRTSISRAAQAAGSAARRRRPSDRSSRASVRGRARARSNTSRAASSSIAAVSCVAERPACKADPHPHAGRLVRGIERPATAPTPAAGTPSAPRGSPAAKRTAPSARAAIALKQGRVARPRRGAPARRPPIARRLDRRRPPTGSRRMAPAVGAARARPRLIEGPPDHRRGRRRRRPWARRSSASPGSGRRPHWPASR